MPPTTVRLRSRIQKELSHQEPATVITFESLINAKRLPKTLQWQPSLCFLRGHEIVLVHILSSPSIPPYLETAVVALKALPNVFVLILARDQLAEVGEHSVAPQMPAAYIAGDVAEKALKLGCGLAFETTDAVHLVFDRGYVIPPRRHGRKETGHIPKWLYRKLAESDSFSPKLRQLLRRFAKRYEAATRRLTISNDRETDLVLGFAKGFAKLDKRFFLPSEGLQTLRHFEMSGATRARDHFFHTFNNLFLGFHILGRLSEGRKTMAEVDKFIGGDDDEKGDGPHAWEILWFLTCISHDPGYLGEKPWANFRFGIGVVQVGKGDAEIPDQFKHQILDSWEGQFAGPRVDLHDLYNRAVRKWVPPTIAIKGADLFDAALRRAYFDGKVASHSLISGLSLINNCRTQNVPRPKKYNPEKALTACVIAALSMMFHDPKCRTMLQQAGIPPIAFESLPYASVLMYVDSLQDDRRDISQSRFRNAEFFPQWQ